MNKAIFLLLIVPIIFITSILVLTGVYYGVFWMGNYFLGLNIELLQTSFICAIITTFVKYPQN